MPQTLAFLSYTRKDDEFFGGYITAFRKTLETGVHVVTGEPTFQLFQDIEGLVIGESWQKKLGEVIHQSSFLVPMLSPLFFNSTPCRDEVGQFLEHERALKRDDLILPVYFLTSAKIEKEEEKTKDPLAKEVARRHMFDWREKANVPLQEPAAREAILALARAIEKAMKRLEAPAVEPAGAAPRPPERGREPLLADPWLAAGVDADVKRETVSPRTILWVDDNPDNNIWERRALESYGVRFVLARDTAEAQQRLRENGPFTAIISDVGRVGDPQAGYTLLKRVREAGIDTPYFIYTAGLAAKLWPIARLRGAQGLTADPDALVEMVVEAFR
jgi:CheY-like chemotaxis protein